MLIGTALTILIQSSSATMALTLVMCANGWIGFDIAASMVLGENIGTTITANLAAMVFGHIPVLFRLGRTIEYLLGNWRSVHKCGFGSGSAIVVSHLL